MSKPAEVVADVDDGTLTIFSSFRHLRGSQLFAQYYMLDHFEL
jgi:hypothetical protein